MSYASFQIGYITKQVSERLVYSEETLTAVIIRWSRNAFVLTIHANNRFTNDKGSCCSKPATARPEDKVPTQLKFQTVC